MTNLEALKKFSRVTGVTDPKVETIVRDQESWVSKKFTDRNATTYAAVDEGEPTGIWAEYFTHFTDQSPQEYKRYVEGNWKPHKKQEEIHREYKKFTYSDTKRNSARDKVGDDRIDQAFNDMFNNIKEDMNQLLWGDDEEYIDAEWRIADKEPLMLPAHEEEEDD